MEIVSLKSFAWTIVLILILAFFAFITLITNSKSESLQSDIRLLQKDNDNYRRIDTCISILYVAENNSRLYVITGDTAYHTAYSNQMRTVSSILDDYDQEKRKQSFSSSDLSLLLADKQMKNDEFIYLKKLVDSLLTSQIIPANDKETVPKARSYEVGTTEITKADSVRVVPNKQNKRLWKRIVDAVTNKPPDSTLINSTKHNTTIVRNSLTKEKQLPGRTGIPDQSGNFSSARKKLNATELALLEINNQIFSRLQAALKALRANETNNLNNLKNAVIVQASSQLEELNNLSWGNVAVVLILTILIIVNIARLYKSEVTIQQYSLVIARSAERKADFLAKVSHEIRTPLNSIIGFSQQIDVSQLNADLRVKINAIKNASDILLMLVNEILDFSKLESGKIQLVSHEFRPVELLENVAAMLSVLAEKKKIVIHKQFELPSGLMLLGDDFRIKQIVINILTNAIKFTPAGGEVRVHAVFDHKDNSRESAFIITITDSGIGIEEKNLKRIFDDFTQIETPDEYSRELGTGLGLPIAKKIVDLCKGTIRVTSAPEKGSVFTVSLPLAVYNAGSNTAEKRLEIADILNNKKLLLTDDVKINLLLISSIMDKYGISHDIASNGEEAFALFKSRNYDLIITDIQIPKIDGVQLTRLIRKNKNKKKSAVPVIGYTGEINEKVEVTYRNAGMNEFLYKPFTENDLREVLSRIVF